MLVSEIESVANNAQSAMAGVEHADKSWKIIIFKAYGRQIVVGNPPQTFMQGH